MKTAILSLLMIAFSVSTISTASADLSSEAAVELSAVSATSGSTSTDATAELDLDVQNFPYWYPLGCVRHPNMCFRRARMQGFYYWNAVQDPFRCGYYALACYGSY